MEIALNTPYGGAFFPGNKKSPNSFKTAVVASIVFHALMLFAWKMDLGSFPAHTASFRVTLSSSAPSPTATIKREPAQVVSPDEAVRIAPTQKMEREYAKPIEQKASATAPTSSVSAPTQSVAQHEPQPQASSISAGPGNLGNAVKEDLASGTGSGTSVGAGVENTAKQDNKAVSTDALRRYQRDLFKAMSRYRIYPRGSRSRGEEGITAISFSGSSSGAVTAMLADSSSYQDLDSAALTMAERAIAAISLPEDLKGKAFSFKAPIQFRLDDF